MLTAFENVVLIFCGPLAALLFLSVLNRLWPERRRHQHNDIIGWHVGVLGTIYAVIMGFMLYAVWTTFQDAKLNAETEANCLVNVFRMANGLPSPQREQIRQLARRYADIVVDQEWPGMHEDELSSAGHSTVQQMWTIMLQTQPSTFGQQTSMNLTLAELSSMTQHRRIRQIESQSKLPDVLWVVLIVGGIITVLSACLFGVENSALHRLQVLILAILVTLILIATADIDRPFQGVVHVMPTGFERARATFAETP